MHFRCKTAKLEPMVVVTLSLLGLFSATLGQLSLSEGDTESPLPLGPPALLEPQLMPTTKATYAAVYAPAPTYSPTYGSPSYGGFGGCSPQIPTCAPPSSPSAYTPAHAPSDSPSYTARPPYYGGRRMMAVSDPAHSAAPTYTPAYTSSPILAPSYRSYGVYQSPAPSQAPAYTRPPPLTGSNGAYGGYGIYPAPSQAPIAYGAY